MNIKAVFDLSQPVVMGILNVTPDSFSDGGKYSRLENALSHTRKMISEGASIIDIGGESTRPGATAVTADEELERVIPVIEAIRKETDIPVSIDSSKAMVLREAIGAGANIINDVRALQENNALQTAAELDVPVCLMHMQGQPRVMQQTPSYLNVVNEVIEFLKVRIAACEQAGIHRENIIIDPGFGFGKKLEHNLVLFKHLDEFKCLGLPIMVGVSRKSMISTLLDLPVEDRLAASLAMAGLAVWLGASIIRAHDVQQTVHAVKMIAAIKKANNNYD
jgi:dihydropteroate synthase